MRAINARHERDRQLTQLAKFDPLTGEMNRAFLTETLAATLDEALRSRGSCGFLLVAIDHLGALNEAYGFEVAEEVIAKVAKRIRAPAARQGLSRPLLRQQVRRHPDALHAATSCRSPPSGCSPACATTPSSTAAGPVAVTVTIGGVTAPRHARTVPEILARAQDALARRHDAPARLVPRLPAECRARRAAPRQRARHRRDHRRAQRAPHRARLSSRWWRRRTARPASTNA